MSVALEDKVHNNIKGSVLYLQLESRGPLIYDVEAPCIIGESIQQQRLLNWGEQREDLPVCRCAGFR